MGEFLASVMAIAAQWMVAEGAAGRTLVAIADGLTADNVATAQGGARWYPVTVRQVLLSNA